MSGIQVGEIDGAETRELRRSVLRPWFGPDDPLPGDDRADAVHLAARDVWLVLSTCFVVPEACPWRPEPDPATHWRLRAMATDPTLRGHGLGGLVLGAAEDAVRRRGGRLLWCHARDYAIPFYERSGWRVDGEGFTEGPEEIPHHNMWKQVDVSTEGRL